MNYIESLRQKVGHDKVFLPGARAIILNEQGEILLQLRTDMNLWGLPAGCVELEESFREGMIREVKEETGLDILEMEPMALYSGKQYKVVYPNKDEVQLISVTFIVRKWQGTPKADGVEGKELQFFPIDRLPPNILPFHFQTLMDFKNYDGHFTMK
jgi:ADP-ribose pyrophosphatase YjhB (NUDIX family)